MKLNNNFKCECCGEEYDEIPFCFGGGYPNYYFSVPPEERNERIQMDESWCIIDEEYFFHKVMLEIPIHDYEENLNFIVWTSVSKDNFCLRMDLWEDDERVNQ